MGPRSTPERYGAVAQSLHWVSAGLILILVTLGVVMTRINDGDNTTMYRIHVTLGLAVAVLTIVRVVWRFMEPSPADPEMPTWRRILFLTNRYGLYIGLFALAITGIGTLLTNDLSIFPPDIVATEVDDVRAGDAHFALALIYSGLFLMHIAGVVSYHRVKGDVLSKMVPTMTPAPPGQLS